MSTADKISYIEDAFALLFVLLTLALAVSRR